MDNRVPFFAYPPLAPGWHALPPTPTHFDHFHHSPFPSPSHFPFPVCIPLSPPLTPCSPFDVTPLAPQPPLAMYPSSPSNFCHESNSSLSRSATPLSQNSSRQPTSSTESSPVQSDRATTPKTTHSPTQSATEGYHPPPRDSFLLVGTVPREATEEELKIAFKSCGELLGIYIRFLLKHGIVILAFYDSRDCQSALSTLHTHSLFPSDDDEDARPLTSRIVSPAQVRTLIGESQFIEDVESGLLVVTPSLVNSNLLLAVLTGYGDVAVFRVVGHSRTSFVCEYFDSRHARNAKEGLDGNAEAFGVPLQVTLRSIDDVLQQAHLAAASEYASFAPFESSHPPTDTSPLPSVSHPSPPLNTPIYVQTQPSLRENSKSFPVVIEDDVDDIPGDVDIVRNQDPQATVAAPSADENTSPLLSACGPRSPTSHSRRCSTGSAFVPGETTPLERSKAASWILETEVEKLKSWAPKVGYGLPSSIRETAKRLSPRRGSSYSGLDALSTAVILPNARTTSVGDTTPKSEPGTPMVQAKNIALPYAQRSFPIRPYFGGAVPCPAAVERSTGATPFPFSPQTTPSQTDNRFVYSTTHYDIPAGSSDSALALNLQLYHSTSQHRAATSYPASSLTASTFTPRVNINTPREPSSPRNLVDIDKIESGRDTRTTIMVKNIPSRMTHDDMYKFITKDCPNSFDFLYLRMDFTTGNNVGYAFVNFIDIADLLRFLRINLGQKWNMYSSEKIMHAAYATYQGKAALVDKFQNSSILDREDAVRPHIYCTLGPGRGQPEEFPPPNDSARKARSTVAATEHGLFSQLHRDRQAMAHFPFNRSSRITLPAAGSSSTEPSKSSTYRKYPAATYGSYNDAPGGLSIRGKGSRRGGRGFRQQSSARPRHDRNFDHSNPQPPPQVVAGW